MSLGNEFFGVPKDDPNFDAVAAEVTYNIIMKMDDDEAWAFSSMLLMDHYPNMVRYHGEEIQKALDTSIEKKLDEIKKAAAQTIISKSRSGEDIDAISKAVEVISKDIYDPWERSLNATKQQRGPGGRFRRYKTTFNYSGVERPLPKAHAAGRGIPDPEKIGGRKVGGKKISAKERARYQQAYMQLDDLISPLVNAGESAVVEIRNADNSVSLHDISDVRENLAGEFTNKKTPRSATVIVNPDINVAGASYDLLGGSQAGVAAINAANYANSPEARVAGGRWNKGEQGDLYNPSNLAYRRIGAASELAEGVADATGVMSPKVRLAIGAGKFVGNSGQDVQSVIGPTADKAAYRYRGTERPPEPRLQAIMNEVRNKESKTGGNLKRARDFIIHGTSTGVADPTNDPRDLGYRIGNKSYKESPVIEYFKGRLPSRDLAQLQAKSGTITPSEGIIIDKTGKVTTQAIGYGEDHYMPFNLKNLKSLRGGEYVRTRSMGGPTTEDVYTGLMAGATAATVVSNSGTFTLEFDPSFRGSRRYSDKALRMINRYGHLLDAVESGEVTLADVHPTRKKELRESAQDYAGGDDSVEAAQYDKMLKKERKNPSLSRVQREEIATEILADKASKLRMSDVDEPSVEDLLGNFVNTQAGDDPEYRQQLLSEVSDPVKAVAALGLESEYETQLTEKTLEYQRSLRPIKLDGQGYAYALTALQEQFPYYITNVTFRDLDHGYDAGYVKPRFNRPAKALSGYFDTSIAGAGSVRGSNKDKEGNETKTGKVSADRTRFQNQYGASMNNLGSETKEDTDATPAAPKEAPSANETKTVNSDKEINVKPSPKETLDAVDAIVATPNLSFKGDDGQVYSLVNAGGFDSALTEAFPALFGSTSEERAQWFRSSDPADQAKQEQLFKELRQIQGNNGHVNLKGKGGQLNVPMSQFKRATGQTKKYPLNLNDELTLDGIKKGENVVYSLGADFDPGRSTAQYIRTLKDDSDGIVSFASAVGLDIQDPDSRDKSRMALTNLAAQRVQSLEQIRAYRKHIKDGTLPDGAVAPADSDTDRLEKEITRIAKLRQLVIGYGESEEREGLNVPMATAPKERKPSPWGNNPTDPSPQDPAPTMGFVPRTGKVDNNVVPINFRGAR
jgi:hypothetical protein